jgi:ABC-type lipoprotein export system ATPase subunit
VSDHPILEVKGLVKNYGAPDGNPLPVLKGIDLVVRQAETVAVTGPSGSGKSTLLNIVGTLDTGDEGTVVFDGRDLSSLKADELFQVRRAEIGFVFQKHHLLPHLTALENVLVPSVIEPRAGRLERARGLLEKVGLEGRMDHRPAQLSVGERQRVAVARSLINSPRLLLADEPTGSLDREGAETLGALLVEMNRLEDTTLLMVTHSETLAGKGERVIDLRDGVLTERRAR